MLSDRETEIVHRRLVGRLALEEGKGQHEEAGENLRHSTEEC